VTNEKVIPLPDKLARIARAIGLELNRQTASNTEWIDSTTRIALLLVEARALHSSDNAFGDWCKANGFGLDVINKNDRAAYIAMGTDPQQLKTVLEKTQRESIYLISLNEFRFPSARKPDDQEQPKGSKKGKKGKKGKKQRTKKTDTKPVQEHVRSAVQNDEAISREKVAKDLNVTEHTVTIARAREEGRHDAFVEINTVSAEALQSASVKEKYVAAVRSMQKKLQHEFDINFREAVRVEVQKQCDATFPRLQEAQDKAFEEEQRFRRYLAETKKIMTVQQFKDVASCLHPDSRISITEEKLKRTFQMFLPKKFALTGEE
jgi:hypothetical protein